MATAPREPLVAEPAPDGVVVVRLPAAVGRAGTGALCARLREQLLATDVPVAVLDVAALAQPDVDTVDTLARVLLTARRIGRTVQLRHAAPRLLELLALCGLDDVLACEPPD
ncbi:STAS domain-containing protein [Egicoccus sp. AB-alg2]|uniref:STAS domain-containing protein n=1 Tax=Egicoccus sp. AB-alg2 TaxID=3242693 RepID=UPI00359DD3CD